QYGVTPARQLERDGLDGSHVVGDVLTDTAVATGGGTLQLSLFEKQADGNAVDFGFAVELQRPVQFQASATALLEAVQLALIEHLLQRQHGHTVRDFPEARQRRTADSLGRRVGRNEFRVSSFQGQQLREQL